MKVKTKINKWDLIKLKSFGKKKKKFWHSKGTKAEIQHTEWEKMFSNEATSKGLISKMYKKLMQLNICILKKKKGEPLNHRMGRRSK